MTLDEKEKKKNPIKNDTVTLDADLIIDLSSAEVIDDDGSVSEPSFSSDKNEEMSSGNDEDDVEELGEDDEGPNEEEPLEDSENNEEIGENQNEQAEDNENSGEEIGDESPQESEANDTPEEIPESSEEPNEEPSEESALESNDEPTEASEPSSDESEPEESSPEPVSEGNESVEDDKTSGSDTEDVSDSKDTPSETSDTSDSSSDTSSESDSGKESSSDEKPVESDSKEASSDVSDDKTKSDGKSDNKDDKSGKKDDNKKDNKPDGKDAKDAAKDAAKDTAKDAAKDAAKDTAKDAAKDVAKDAAKEGAKDLAKDAAKDNPASDKAEIAKNTKDALKRGPEGLTGSPGIRAALAASENTNAYSKAGATAVKILDKIIGKENTDKLLDKLGESAIKSAAAGLIMGLISLLLPIVFLVLTIYMIFAPLLDALMSVEKVAIDIANTAEKFANLYVNGNFADSKTTFYQELDRLGNIYGSELDSTLLLTTLFYSDMKNGYQTKYDDLDDVMDIGAAAANYTDDDSKQAYKGSFITLMYEEIQKIETEATGTYDASTGYMYTIGKVYRLKLLAGAMFQQTFFGDASGYSTKTMYLDEWIATYGGQCEQAIKDVMSDLLSSLAKGMGLTLLTGIPIPAVFMGDELQNLKILINCLFLGAMSISSIDTSEGTSLDKIKITYFTYKYSEENYRKYLKETYIPKNKKDFEEFLSYDSEGNIIEDSIDKIIDEIFEYKKYFDDIFTVHEDDTEDYNMLCIGAIDRKLASALSSPVEIKTDKCIEFLDKNGYGYTTDGKLHNGIELNKESTGNVEGDKVHAVLDGGTVKASSADSTLECNGGCIEIGYKYSIEGTVQKSSYEFSIIYKGLSKSSVTLKTGDEVTDQQEVGTIGTASESEDLSISSLYLEFRLADGTAIDPTNMIVKCSAHVGDYPGATIIDIPQTFTQTNYYSVTCLIKEGFDWGCDNAGDNFVKSTSDVYPIYEEWVKQGAKHKNGVAVINVDGVDRYLVAAVKKIGVPGDVLNGTLKDGTVVPMLYFDEKNETDSSIYKVDGVAWGHEKPDGVNVIEMEVSTDDYNAHGRPAGVNNNWNIEWDSNNPFVKISNNGNIMSGTFDLKGSSATAQATSSGIKLCDSMYIGNKVGNIANKAIEFANNDSIGCTTDSTKRNLNPDVDNTSLIYYSLVNSGVLDGQDSVFTIEDMGKVLTENYFDNFNYNENDIKKGDILVYEKDSKQIAIIYIGEDKQVFADPDKADSTTGDANGDEVLVTAFDKTLSYKAVYRYNYERKYGPISKSSNNPVNFLVSKKALISY